MRRYLPLVCLALLHTVVDTSALLVSPLWHRITVECGLVGISLVVVMLAHSMPTSLSQGVFGFIRERRRMRILLLVGPVVAAICLTWVGGVAALGLLRDATVAGISSGRVLTAAILPRGSMEGVGGIPARTP